MESTMLQPDWQSVAAQAVGGAGGPKSRGAAAIGGASKGFNAQAAFPHAQAVPPECYAARTIAEFQQCVMGKSWGSVGGGDAPPGTEMEGELGWMQRPFSISNPGYTPSYGMTSYGGPAGGVGGMSGLGRSTTYTPSPYFDAWNDPTPQPFNPEIDPNQITLPPGFGQGGGYVSTAPVAMGTPGMGAGAQGAAGMGGSGTGGVGEFIPVDYYNPGYRMGTTYTNYEDGVSSFATATDASREAAIMQDFTDINKGLRNDVAYQFGQDALEDESVQGAIDDLSNQVVDAKDAGYQNIEGDLAVELGSAPTVWSMLQAGGIGAGTSMLLDYALTGFDEDETNWGKSAFTGAAGGVASELAVGSGVTIAGSSALAGAAVGGLGGLGAGVVYNLGEGLYHHSQDAKRFPHRVPVAYGERAIEDDDPYGYWKKGQTSGLESHGYYAARDYYKTGGNVTPDGRATKDEGYYGVVGDLYSGAPAYRQGEDMIEGMQGYEASLPWGTTKHVQMLDQNTGMQLQQHIDELGGGAGQHPWIVTMPEAEIKDDIKYTDQYQLDEVNYDLMQTQSMEELDQYSQIFEGKYWKLSGDNTFFDYNEFIRDWDNLTDFSRQKAVNDYHWDRGYFWEKKNKYVDEYGEVDKWSENGFASKEDRMQAEKDWFAKDPIWNELEETRDSGYQDWWDKTIEETLVYTQEELDEQQESGERMEAQAEADQKLGAVVQSNPKNKTYQKLAKILPQRGRK